MIKNLLQQPCHTPCWCPSSEQWPSCYFLASVTKLLQAWWALKVLSLSVIVTTIIIIIHLTCMTFYLTIKKKSRKYLNMQHSGTTQGLSSPHPLGHYTAWNVHIHRLLLAWGIIRNQCWDGSKNIHIRTTIQGFPSRTFYFSHDQPHSLRPSVVLMLRLMVVSGHHTVTRFIFFQSWKQDVKTWLLVH